VKHFTHRRELAKYVLPLAVAMILMEVVLVSAVWRKIP
jgi:hypothetical protein